MELINCVWILVTLLVIILISKILIPKESYKYYVSLVVVIVGVIYFLIRMFTLLSIALDPENEFSFSFLAPGIALIICLIYIYFGGKSLKAKTSSCVVSNVTKEIVGIMNAGDLNWADPLFENVTIDVNGTPNKSIDLRSLRIEIEETPSIQTLKRGIQAKVKNIIIMLQITGDIRQVFNVEDGRTTMKKNILDYVEEFFLEKITHLDPEDLDQNKMDTIHYLRSELQSEVNKYCTENGYPYVISSTPIIGDTELDTKYYEALAKEAFAELDQRALDVEARRIKTRLLDLGKSLLPGSSENEQLKAAMVALKITPKSIEEKTYGASPEILELAKQLVAIIKK
jgi:hypothetical protein